jgi:hypothetical protein
MFFRLAVDNEFHLLCKVVKSVNNPHTVLTNSDIII